MQSGSTLGVGNIPGHVAKYNEAISLMRTRASMAQKQGIILFPDREPFLEVSGTKTAIRTCIKKGWNLQGTILVKAEGPAYENLDIPVIDEKLIELCGSEGMKGVLADARSLIVDESGVKRVLERYQMCIHFI
jgi:DUF1009 family protein